MKIQPIKTTFTTRGFGQMNYDFIRFDLVVDP